LGIEMLTAAAGPVDSPAFSWLVLAFGLGLLHAFDADHVMALSVFATGKRRARDGMRAGLRWSLGHGLVLGVTGVFLFGLGRALPTAFSVIAERAVGGTMVLLGIYVFFDLVRRRGHLHFHEHEGLPPHAHWHSHDKANAHHHDHGPLMVGALHGLAGSAPILAVLPAAARSPGLGLAYLLIFSAGVGLAMAAVSGLLGHFAGRLSSPAHASRSRGITALRMLSATGSIGLGAWIALST
jgi:hypothetical protein